MNARSDLAWIRRPLSGVALLLALSTTVVIAQGPRIFSREWYAQFSGAYSQPVEPFRIVGNIYYVGAENIASYLIATPQGHILIDSGTTEMHDAIASGVERLGYKVSDIRILLASHAHFDHIEGHALMQRRTERGRGHEAHVPEAEDRARAGHRPDRHPQAMFAGTIERMRRDERPHPLLNGADAWKR